MITSLVTKVLDSILKRKGSCVLERQDKLNGEFDSVCKRFDKLSEKTKNDSRSTVSKI